MAALFGTFYAMDFTENTLTIPAILFKIYKDYEGGKGGSAMKFFRCLFKLIVALLAICGACYIFTEVVDALNSEDTVNGRSDDEPLSKRVVKAADRQFHKINKRSEEQI